jgi:hypothetical protein
MAIERAKIPSKAAFNMKELCELKLPPMKLNVKAPPSRSLPVSRQSRLGIIGGKKR